MAIKKNRMTPQDIEDVIACGYPLAQIARESGVDRISLSKFRNHGQALKAADQAALIAWLQENDLWDEDQPAAPAKSTKPAAAEAPAAQVFPLPMIAITIGDEVDEDDAANLIARADEVTAEIKRIAAGKLIYDDILFIKADEPTEDSQAEHQKLHDLLAEFALLQFRMQGNDLAPPLPPELAEDGARLNTHAELLAREFPWPAGETDPDPDADSAEESLAAGTAGKASGRGQSTGNRTSATNFG